MALLRFLGFEVDIANDTAGEFDSVAVLTRVLSYVTGKTADQNPYRSGGVMNTGSGIFTSYAEGRVTITGNPTELWLQFWLYRPTGTDIIDVRTALTLGLCEFRDTGGTAMLQFGIEDFSVGQHFQLRRGDAVGTLLDTGDKVFTVGSASLIQIHYKASDTVGEVEVYVDGTLDMSFSGDTTNALTTIGEIRFGHLRYLDGAIEKGATGTFEFDDIAIDSEQFPNNFSSTLVNITGDGTYTQWDLTGAASTFDCVDDFNSGGAPGTATLISTSVADEQASVVGTAGFSTANDGIVGVRILGYAGGPGTEDMRYFLRVGTVDYNDTAFTPGAYALEPSGIWTTNPATSANWVAGTIGAIEFGVQMRAQ